MAKLTRAEAEAAEARAKADELAARERAERRRESAKRAAELSAAISDGDEAGRELATLRRDLRFLWTWLVVSMVFSLAGNIGHWVTSLSGGSGITHLIGLGWSVVPPALLLLAVEAIPTTARVNGDRRDRVTSVVAWIVVLLMLVASATGVYLFLLSVGYPSWAAGMFPAGIDLSVFAAARAAVGAMPRRESLRGRVQAAETARRELIDPPTGGASVEFGSAPIGPGAPVSGQFGGAPMHRADAPASAPRTPPPAPLSAPARRADTPATPPSGAPVHRADAPGTPPPGTPAAAPRTPVTPAVGAPRTDAPAQSSGASPQLTLGVHRPGAPQPYTGGAPVPVQARPPVEHSGAAVPALATPTSGAAVQTTAVQTSGPGAPDDAHLAAAHRCIDDGAVSIDAPQVAEVLAALAAGESRKAAARIAGVNPRTATKIAEWAEGATEGADRRVLMPVG